MKYVNIQPLFYAISFAAIAALLSITQLSPTDYERTADEGNYFNQAQIVANQGIAGIKTLGTDYLSNPNQHNTPAPIRLLHTLYTVPFVWFFGNISGLGCASSVAFLLMLGLGAWAFRRWFGDMVALAWLVLAGASPLGLGLARRALMDAPQTAFLFAVIIVFVAYIRQKTTPKFYTLLILMGFAPLYKETNLLLIPIFAATLIYQQVIDNERIKYINILTICVLPVVAWGASLWFVFDGWAGVEAFFDIYKSAIAPPPAAIQYGVGAYNYQFGSGGWVQYFMDFLLLSPIVFVLFLTLVIYFINQKSPKNRTLIYLLLIIGMLWLSYNLFTKNVRYVFILDPLMRLFVVVFLINIYKKISSKSSIPRKIFAAASVLLIVFELWQFNFYFITKKIYDPTTYNLLVAKKIIPTCAPVAAAYKLPQTATDYINLSQKFYDQKNYTGCVSAATECLKLSPKNAAAYNNMGAAYNNLNQYEEAIAVLQVAIQLQPDNTLAINNLRYAQSMLQK